VEKQREIKQLRDEFADLIREAKEDAPPAPPAPAPPPDGAAPAPAPAPGGAP
jgi:hypothetical protein